MKARVTAGFICDLEVFQPKIVSTHKPRSMTNYYCVKKSRVNTKVPKNS